MENDITAGVVNANLEVFVYGAQALEIVTRWIVSCQPHVQLNWVLVLVRSTSRAFCPLHKASVLRKWNCLSLFRVMYSNLLE